jgi:hypothetical protein
MHNHRECPCADCQASRESYARLQDEMDAEAFSTWKIRESQKHINCTSLETMCPQCRKWYEDNERWVAQATAQDWADYFNEILGNNTNQDEA